MRLQTPMAQHLAEHARHTVMPGLEAIIASEAELEAIETQAHAAGRAEALGEVRERVEGLREIVWASVDDNDDVHLLPREAVLAALAETKGDGA